MFFPGCTSPKRVRCVPWCSASCPTLVRFSHPSSARKCLVFPCSRLSFCIHYDPPSPCNDLSQQRSTLSSAVEALRLTMRASGALLDGAMIHFLVVGQPATVDFQWFAIFVQLLLVISFTVCQIVPCSRICVRSGASDAPFLHILSPVDPSPVALRL